MEIIPEIYVNKITKTDGNVLKILVKQKYYSKDTGGQIRKIYYANCYKTVISKHLISY